MRFITLKDNVVTAIRYGKNPLEHEMKSEEGKLGQILQGDGSFVNPEKGDEDEEELSADDKINFLYYKEMGLI